MRDRQPLEVVATEAMVKIYPDEFFNTDGTWKGGDIPFDPAKYFGDDDGLEEVRKQCGKTIFTWCPHTGKPKLLLWRCKDFRTCPTCAKIRIDDERAFLNKVIAHTGVESFRLFVAADEDEAKKAALTLGRKKIMYRRYPSEDEVTTTFIFEDSNVNIKSVKIDQDDLHKLVPGLVHTQVGKRISGNMTKYLPVEDEVTEENKKYIERVTIPVLVPVDARQGNAMAVTMDEVRQKVVQDVVDNRRKVASMQELFDIIVSKTYTKLILRGIEYQWISQRTYDIDVRTAVWDGVHLASILDNKDYKDLDQDALFDEDPGPN